MKAYAGGGVRLAGGIGGMPGGAQAFCASAKDMVSALARMEASAALRELCIVQEMFPKTHPAALWPSE